MNLNKKNTLVTGASRGIGLALAKGFAKRGSSLFLVARRFPDHFLQEFPEEVRSRVHLLNYDLGEKTQVEGLIDELIQRTSIDILVNNAGVLTGGRLQNIKSEDIERAVAVNLTAPMLLARGLLPAMVAKKSGLIINNASVSGQFYFPGSQVYAATKGGLVLFTKSLRLELENTGVKTLLLMTPGVKTRMFDEIRGKYSSLMDLSLLSSISPEEWAHHVLRAVDRGASVCYPKGGTRLGLFLNRHFPKLWERGVRRFFKGHRTE